MKNKNFLNKNYGMLKLFLFVLSIFFVYLENPDFFFENGLGFLSYFSFIPVLFLLKRISFKSSWIYGIFFGTAVFFIFCHSFFTYDILVFVLFLIIYVIFYSVYFALLKYADNKFIKNGWLIQWIIACGFDFIKSVLLPGFDFGSVVYTQWKYPLILKITRVIGIYGLNALILFPSFLIYGFIHKLIDKNRIRTNRDTDNELYECKTHINYISKYEIQLKSTTVILPVLCFLVYAAVSFFIIRYGITSETADVFDGNKVTVCNVQNYETLSEEKSFSIRNSAVNIMKLTDEALDMNDNIDIVLWPEHSVLPSLNYSYDSKLNPDEKKLTEIIAKYIKNHKESFIIGNYTKTLALDRKYDSALIYTENAESKNCYEYDKNFLVPITEFIPFSTKVIKSNYQKKNLNYCICGKDIKNFTIKNNKIGILLGNEERINFLSRKNVKKGADCLIVLCDENFSKSSSFLYENLARTVVNCTANSIPLVRCSNTGCSCIVNEDGRVNFVTSPFCKTYSVGQVFIEKKVNNTFYTDYGDAGGLSFAVLSLLLLIIAGFTDIIKKNRKSGKKK